MQFFRSLFCFRGYDNRPRFFAISNIIYILCILLTPVFKGNIFIFVLFLTLFTLVLSLTTLRRLHDARLNKNVILAPSLTFLLIATITIFTEQSTTFYLFIIPMLCSSILLTYPSSKKLNFILGYYGPIDMQEYQLESTQQKLRIEPTLIQTQPVNIDNDSIFNTIATDDNNYFQDNKSSNRQEDLGEIIRLKILSNMKTPLFFYAVLGLMFIAFTTYWLLDFVNTPENTLDEINPSQITTNNNHSLIRNHPLPMPDNYTLHLSEYRGISINWQADEVSSTVLWSQTTAIGDDSCKEITFDKGEALRTLSVRIESTASDSVVKQNNYFAYFSPLDSKALVQALAFRSNFTLCGYHFSLKGSQAVLASNEQYAQWISY